MESKSLSFQQILDNTKKSVFGEEKNEASETIDRHEKELKESDIPKLALKVGDKIPDFILKNAVGELVNIKNLMTEKWLVISFYRGQWCPFCQIELRNLQKNLETMERIPSKLVAISPQTPDNSLTTKEKNELTFEVLSDEGSLVAKKFNLVYDVPDYLIKIYEKGGVDLQYMNGKGKMQLPLPATYIIDNEGTIKFSFVETSAVKRMDPKDIIQFMREN